jgi:hypothetical protein
MKRLLLALAMVVLLAGFVAADGRYDVEINGSQVVLELVPGPFGPGESGRAGVYVNDALVLSSTYQKTQDQPIYTVEGLGTFFAWNQYLIFYQDLLGKPMMKELEY